MSITCQMLNHGVMKEELGTQRNFILVISFYTYLWGAYSVPDRGKAATWKC